MIELPFEYHPTEHECPECGQSLTQVDVSTMLVCVEGHGPYFLA
jgi:predicted RNA-binding Zn-ribbon protein involved in translation (DUF1610 family)